MSYKKVGGYFSQTVGQMLQDPTARFWMGSGGGGGAVTSITTTGTGGPATLTTGVLNIPQYAGTVASLTTTGSSGAATLISGVLNIPNYAGGVATVSNADSTLTISPTSGAVVASLNLAHANTWTGAQTVNIGANGAAEADGILLSNTTAATSSVQQWSPGLIFTGQGWKTTATAASQSVVLKTYLVTVSGTTNPVGALSTQFSINGGALTPLTNLSTDGLNAYFDIWAASLGSNVSSQVRFLNASGGVLGYMTATNQNGQVVVGAVSGFHLRLQSQGVDRLVFAPTTGNCMIGSTTDGGQKFQVTGTSQFTGNMNVTGTFAASSTSTAPTPTAGDSTTNIATTAFVTNANAVVTSGIDPMMVIMKALGSSIKGQTPWDLSRMNNQAALSTQTVRWIPVNVPVACTLTGAEWYQYTQGSYTANNYNGVGLYSYSAGTLTLIASSTNDGSIWQTAATGTWGSKAFSSTIAVAAGAYFVSLLYCRSAEATAPGIGTGYQPQQSFSVDFTNSAKMLGLLSSQTVFPSTVAMSAVSAGVNPIYIFVY